MTSFLLDTNILIDLVVGTRPKSEDSRNLLRDMLRSECEFHCLGSSLKDVYCICRRAFKSERDLRKAVRWLRDITNPLDLKLAFIDGALVSDEPNLEDSIVRAAAEVCRFDLIVTHDEGAFRSSSVPAVSAREARRLLRGE